MNKLWDREYRCKLALDLGETLEGMQEFRCAERCRFFEDCKRILTEPRKIKKDNII